MKSSRRRPLLMCVVAVAAMATTPAHAYLDPGTGSAIVSTILGFFAAIAFTVRRYYYRIKAFFRSKTASDASDEG